MIQRELGKAGEQLAAEYLKKKGYKIERFNYLAGKKEIDIIAVDGKTLVFVEVKLRRNGFYGSGAEAVDRNKQNNIIQAAKIYLFRHKIVNTQIRFDVVEIGEDEINHYIDAFEC